MYDKIIIVAYKKKLKSFQTFWEKPNILQQTFWAWTNHTISRLAHGMLSLAFKVC